MAVWVCSCLVILVKLCRVKERYGSLGTLRLGKSCSVLVSCGTVRQLRYGTLGQCLLLRCMLGNVKAVAVSSVGASWVDARCVTVRRAVFWQSRYVKLCPVEVCFGSLGKLR